MHTNIYYEHNYNHALMAIYIVWTIKYWISGDCNIKIIIIVANLYVAIMQALCIFEWYKEKNWKIPFFHSEKNMFLVST